MDRRNTATIYLDYNATAPLRPQVIAAMSEAYAQPLNASSAHRLGRQAKKIVEDTRRDLAEFLNCWPQEIIWCGSATEANNAVVNYFNPPAAAASFFTPSADASFFTPTACGGGKGGALSTSEKAGSTPKKVGESPPSIPPASGVEEVKYGASGVEEVRHGTIGVGVKNFVASGAPVLISSTEHSTIMNAAEGLELIPVTSAGVVDLDWLEQRLAQPNKPALLSVMFANNETGVLQPIKEVVALAKVHGVLVHTDTVQAVGKVPLDFTTLGVDYMTLSFHKNGGPVGIAALVVKNGAPFAPYLRGGGQEFNRRAGTENVAAIAGVQALLKCWSFDELTKVKAWLENMEQQLMQATRHTTNPATDFNIAAPTAEAPIFTPTACGGGKGGAVATNTDLPLSSHQPPLNPPRKRGGDEEENGKRGEDREIDHKRRGKELESLPQEGNLFSNLQIISQSAPRLGNTICLIHPTLGQEVQLMRLDLAGICVSAGSACTSGKIEPSHVLKAMGIPDEAARRAIRISAGWDTKKADCDAFVKEYRSLFT